MGISICGGELGAFGERYVHAGKFCNDLSLVPLGHSFVRDGEGWNVWRFAQEAHALKFIARFGGEMIAAQDRTKWPGKVKRGIT